MSVYAVSDKFVFLIELCFFQTIKAAKPNFTPDLKPQRIDYACPLLSALNKSCEVRQKYIVYNGSIYTRAIKFCSYA